jgi:2,3-bisphosphoglycerate-independent phosphoglycerate mutase
MKFVVLQVDGLSDTPCADLGGKTPLEQARTPNMDRLAGRGIFGLTRTVPHAMAPTSDVGALSVLGFDPALHHTAVAPLEAVSLGIELGPDDVAFRMNLVTLGHDPNGVEVMEDSAGGHPTAEEARQITADLARALGVADVELHPGLGYRQLLVWRRGEDGARTTPPYDLCGKPISSALPSGPRAGVLTDLMQRARELLATHPLCEARVSRGERAPNAVWLWGQGKRTTLPTLRELHGVEGSVVAALDLMRGLGLLVGLRKVSVPGATGFLDTDFRGKVDRGLGALADRDFLWLHVAAPDEAGHLGDAQKKVQTIEDLDDKMVGPLLEGLAATGGEWRLLLVSGHPTPCALKAHTAEPVPFVVYVASDERKERSSSRTFHERDARDQGIFVPEAHVLLGRLLRR